MQRALSTHLFVNTRLTSALLQEIEQAALPTVEIFCAKQHFDYTDAGQVREIAAWFADHPLQLRSLHAPIYSDAEWGRSGSHAVINLAEIEPLRRQASLDEVKRALEVAERIPFRYLVQHVGVPGEVFAPKKLDLACTSLESLLEFARARGVQVLLENIPNEFSTPQRLRAVVDAVGPDDLCICFDTGHAHMGGGVEADFEPLRDLVVSTHIHDNNGRDDDHLFPFQGTIDWEGTMRALATSPQDLPLQFEVRDFGQFPQPLQKTLESYQRLEELVPTPRS